MASYKANRVPEIRAFIFDMDGVLVDSNPLHRAAWEEYNARHGIRTTEAMQQRMYGKRNDEIVRDFFGEHLSGEEVFAHGAAKEALYREMLKPRMEATLVPGLRPFLRRHHRVPMAVGTNAERANVEFVLKDAELSQYFHAVVDAYQVRNGKPHPEIFLLASGLLGIAPEFCVVFEDSSAGVQAALAAGMRVVGLSTTHDQLPGVSLLIGNFNDPALEIWLSRQT